MAVTTIQLRSNTREKLEKLKLNERESYDALLNRLLALIPDGDEEGPYADAFRLGLLQAREDFRHGRLVDHSDVKRRLGL